MIVNYFLVWAQIQPEHAFVGQVLYIKQPQKKKEKGWLVGTRKESCFGFRMKAKMMVTYNKRQGHKQKTKNKPGPG